MTRIRRRVDPILMFLSGVPGLAGLATLIPWPQAGKTCLLGYRALCSFAPVSSLICFAASFYLWRFLSGGHAHPVAPVEQDAGEHR
jgi:hypothetical protein